MCFWLTLYSPLIVAQSASPNYKVEEQVFGIGSELDATSTNYRSQQSLGSLGVGLSSSANYKGFGGFLTMNQIYLAMSVSGATVELGDLSDTSTSSGAAQAGLCNCSFTVRTYLSSAYVVITASQPPTSESGAIIDAKTVLDAPSTDQNVEEFGINVVDNATPDIGANPVNQPDNTFADGQAATGYDTPNQFKYGVGDIIANSAANASNQAIGETDYTISYIAKRKPLTEAGSYKMQHVLVTVATF